MKVRLTLKEEMLGTKAANPDVFADFIASKHPKGTPAKDELDNAEHREEAGTTVFHRVTRKSLAAFNPVLAQGGDPEEKLVGIYDYQVKGFFKDACGSMNRFDKEHRDGLDKLSAYRSKIDGCIFVKPRFIPVLIPTEAKVGVCERPLRADTPQGPRVSVCRSETVPAGCVLEFEIEILAAELKPYVKLWLGYGAKRGLGQWRNSGKGVFEFQITND